MAPDIVSEELIHKIWRHFYKGSDVSVINNIITPVGEPGDYYSSVMTRVTSTVRVNGTEEKKQVIIKTLPEGEAVLGYAKSNRIFEKEAEMLQNVVPELEKILSSVDVHVKLGAKVYYTQEEPFLIALEDLSQGNFGTVDRYTGLSLEKCLQVVRKLAMFHAASIVYLRNHPNSTSFYKKYIWGPQNRDSIDINLNSALTTIIENIDTWSNEKWSEKLKKLQDRSYPQEFYNKIVEINALMVLNHGDLWHSNIMFNSEYVCFVDFQQSWLKSPVFDLLFFVFTSPQADVRFRNLPDILAAYYQRLEEVSRLLDVRICSFEELKKDFFENIIFGFAMFQYVFPVVTAPANKELQNAKEGDDYMRGNPAFFNPKFQKAFLDGLPFFEENRLFD